MSILFVYAGKHPAHEPFIKAVNADVYPAYRNSVNGFRRFIEAFRMAKEYPDYDVYILEGGIPMFPMYIRKKLLKKDGVVIGLLADETFVNLVERLPYYSTAETFIHKISADVLDGAIAVSGFVRDYAKRIVDVPIEVAKPAIPKENYIKLVKVKPDLESKIIVSVGEARFAIGMDVLVEQFAIAKKKIPELELWIIGKGHPKDYEKVRSVRVLGYVEDLSEVFEKASLFVHAGRASAYPVCTLEAMRAGLPVIVSSMTGTKDIVYEVGKIFEREFGKPVEFVKPLSKLHEAIIDYFRLSKEEREFLSKEYRKRSEEFEPERRGEHFKKAFNNILEEIGYG